MRITESNWKTLVNDDNIQLTDEEWDKALELETKERKQKVLHAINDLNVRTIIDDHDGQSIDIDGYAILTNGNVCPLFNSQYKYYGLNSLYVDEKDNTLHMSTSMVGEVIYRIGDIHQDIKKYNEDRLNYRKSANEFLSSFYQKDYPSCEVVEDIPDGIIEWQVF
jgi:RNase P/RNase MRP subunit p29